MSYENSFLLALEYPIESIAFPSISTGVYSFPIEIAAQIALETLSRLSKDHSKIKEIILVSFNNKT